jgi:hypothetical protein
MIYYISIIPENIRREAFPNTSTQQDTISDLHFPNTDCTKTAMFQCSVGKGLHKRRNITNHHAYHRCSMLNVSK